MESTTTSGRRARSEEPPVSWKSAGAGALALLTLAVAPAAAQLPALTPFQQDALKAIYAVQPFERGRFTLSVNQDPAPVILYADAQAAKELARIDCVSNATFTMLSEANEAGVIAVNVCPEHAGRIRALAATSAQAFDAMLAQVRKGTEPMPDDKLRALGWYRERSALPGGGELHYLSVVAVGHGVAILPTVVLLTSTQAVVVQTESMRLCRLTDVNPGPSPFALCSDPKGTLSAIAQRLLR